MFKNILLAHKNTFVHVVMASFLANLVALAASLYSMQVYDRVIPTQGVSTLMVLTVGVLFATVFELVIKMMRSAMLRDAIRDIDLILSHKIFLRLLGIRMDQFPASVGTLSAQLRSYETIRNFAFSITLYLAVDAPFALLFLAVIAMLAGIQRPAFVVNRLPGIADLLRVHCAVFARWRIFRRRAGERAFRDLGEQVPEASEHGHEDAITGTDEADDRGLDAGARGAVDEQGRLVLGGPHLAVQLLRLVHRVGHERVVLAHQRRRHDMCQYRRWRFFLGSVTCLCW
jgi:hypothetical protein